MPANDIERRISEAEAAVAQGVEHVRRLRELVTDLDRDGYDSAAAEARKLLGSLEGDLRLRVADFDRIKLELRG